VDALLDHPKIRAVSFVGSTPIAKYVYARAGATGKRAQCQGGAKNHVIVLPDADMKMATQIISDSAFGCAGQRCLAVSVAVTIGEHKRVFASRSPQRPHRCEWAMAWMKACKWDRSSARKANHESNC